MHRSPEQETPFYDSREGSVGTLQTMDDTDLSHKQIFGCKLVQVWFRQRPSCVLHEKCIILHIKITTVHEQPRAPHVSFPFFIYFIQNALPFPAFFLRYESLWLQHVAALWRLSGRWY